MHFWFCYHQTPNDRGYCRQVTTARIVTEIGRFASAAVAG